jgi:hypothetical protein
MSTNPWPTVSRGHFSSGGIWTAMWKGRGCLVWLCILTHGQPLCRGWRRNTPTSGWACRYCPPFFSAPFILPFFMSLCHDLVTSVSVLALHSLRALLLSGGKGDSDGYARSGRGYLVWLSTLTHGQPSCWGWQRSTLTSQWTFRCSRLECSRGPPPFCASLLFRMQVHMRCVHMRQVSYASVLYEVRACAPLPVQGSSATVRAWARIGFPPSP